MELVWVFFILALVCFVLGFVALLKQKTYLDENGKPTEIEVLGFKFKTNLPALVFVFVGLVFGYLSYEYMRSAELVDWEITGQIAISEKPATEIDWNKGYSFDYHPDILNGQLRTDGSFKVKIKVPREVDIQKYLSYIHLTHPAIMGGIHWEPGSYTNEEQLNDGSITFKKINHDKDLRYINVEIEIPEDMINYPSE